MKQMSGKNNMVENKEKKEEIMKKNMMRNLKKRALALVLCFAMVLNGGVTTFAEENQGTVPEVENTEYKCGFEAHEHEDTCYSKELLCEENAEPVLTCVIETHEHEAACYEEPVLKCEKTEHKHGDTCYTAHVHGAACYTVACTESTEPILSCTTEAYAHTDSCYTAHVHGEDCYEDKLTCTVVDCTHEEAGCYTSVVTCAESTDRILVCEKTEHEHGEACYTVHEHGDGCYTVTCIESTEPVLTCTTAEYIHTESCYEEPVLKCEKTEHVHDEETCYFVEHVHEDKCYTEPILICEKPVHIHTDECKKESEKIVMKMVKSLKNVGGSNWTWNEETTTLTLKGGEVTGLNEALPTLPNGTTIELESDASIAGGEKSAITCEGVLTINGSGKLTLTGYNGIEATSIKIEGIDVDIDATSMGLDVYNKEGDAKAVLKGVRGNITGGYAGIHVNGEFSESNASVVIEECDIDTTSTATSWNNRARKSGITVYVSEAKKVESSITIKNSIVDATGFDAGLSINNYLSDSDATNSASARINISDSTVKAHGTNGTWSGIFASVLGQHPDADSIITITDSSVYAVSPNTGILTSSQKGDSKIILDNSILGASGKTALSMIEPGSQAQAAELNNGSTYLQMTPGAVMKGEIVSFNGKTIIATAGDGITYNEEKNYYVIPQGSVVTETYTDGTTNRYTFRKQAGGIGGDGYDKEEIWGYDGYVCEIVETGVKYVTLEEAVAAANASSDADTIKLLQNIDFSSDSNKKLAIKGDTTIIGEYIISRGTYAGTMFEVSANGKLTLDGSVILDGNNNWTFDSEGYYADMAAGKTLSTGAKNSYTASNGTEVTAAMISILNKGAVVVNKATIQNSYATNNNTGALFKVPAGASLTVAEGALIQHIHSSVAGQVSGTWTMNGGTISDVYGHNSNGGVVDLRNNGAFTINGGEIKNVRTLGLNANGNGILVQAYGEGTRFTLNDCNIHDNASFSPGGGWGCVVYMNRGGDFTMNGGIIKDTKSDKCTAFVANRGTSIELKGGTIVVDNNTAKSFESLFWGNVNVYEGMKIVVDENAISEFFSETNERLNIDGTIEEGTIQIMYHQPVTGTGVVTSDVIITADEYFEFDGKVTFTGVNWLDSLITVNSIGTDASLTVENKTTIDGVQVRVLGSVPSGDYKNSNEAAAEQAAAYVKNGGEVKSPVLYYHRLTNAQKENIVVTYDYNGGLDASGWSGSQITSAEAFVPTAPIPTKEGLALAGWKVAVESEPESLSMEGSGDYIEGSKVDTSVRLIAQWNEPVCYIKETGVYYVRLTDAVAKANASEGNDTIVMIKDIDFDSDKTLSVVGNITIISEEGTNHVISRGDYTGTLFTVPTGSSLTLDGGIVFDGSNNWIFDKALYENDLYNRGNNAITAYAYSAKSGTVATAAMFVVNGSITANEATIQNCFNTQDSNAGDGAIFKVNANAILDTDGVLINHVATYGANAVAHLSKNAKWYIQGDTIISNNFGGRNGGMCRNDSGQIYMSGGTIKDNAGKNVNGSVFMMYGNGSQLIMTGGTICGNSSVFGINNGRCAAVYLHSQSYMKMTGGKICHNIGGSRGGIDSYQTNAVLDINRSDQVFVNGVYENENGKDAYTASNHPMVIDNISLLDYPTNDVGNTYIVDQWWITGGIYTQDVDEFCAKGYICIPYEDSERTDDYIVVPGYRVKYFAVEKIENEDGTVKYEENLVRKYFHMLPRDKFWHEMDEHALSDSYTNGDTGRTIYSWYTEKELTNLYDFTTQLESDLNLYGEYADRYGYAVIEVQLNEYNLTNPASISVFEVKAVKDGNVVYNDIETITLTSLGTGLVKVGPIVAGAEVTVTAVYEGASYNLTTESDAQTVVANKYWDACQTYEEAKALSLNGIPADDTVFVKFTFAGSHNDVPNGGYGIISRNVIVEER